MWFRINGKVMLQVLGLIPVKGDTAVVAPVIVQERLATPQLSAVVGLGTFTKRVQTPTAVVVAILLGQAIVGGVASVTVTAYVQVAVLPATSVTVQVTVVVPIGKAAGALLVTETNEQLSAVVGVPKATPVAVQAVFVVVLIGTGQIIVGACISFTVMVKLQEVVLLEASVTVKVLVVVPTGKVEPEAIPAV